MYGVWILTIIFSFLALLGLVFGLFFMKRKKFMSNENDDTCAVCGLSLFVVFLCAVIFCSFAGGYGIYCANEQLLKFEQTQKLVEIHYQNGIDLNNQELSERVIEQNEWLMTAKREKKKLGVFSQYYYIDLESIEPIKLLEKEQKESEK